MLKIQNGRLKREKWHEWFRVEIGDGYCMRFYFPTEKVYGKNLTVCWVWYLVPFVLFGKMFAIFVKSIYLDTRDLLDEWKECRKKIAFPIKHSRAVNNPLMISKYDIEKFVPPIVYFDESFSECNCYDTMFKMPKEKVVVHLFGCEEHEATKEYDKLVWWKKLFTRNPRNHRVFDKA